MNHILAAQGVGDQLREVIAAVSTSPETAGVAGMVTAGVLGWSAAGKARNRYASAVALVRFGVTKSPSIRAATALIAWEATLALAVVTSLVVAPAVAVATLALAAATFAGFTLGIARSLSRGHRFACMCFGSSETLVSPFAIGRAATMAVTAGVGAAVAAGQMTPLQLTEAFLSVTVAAGTLSALVLARHLPQVWNHSDPFVFEVTLVPPERGAR